MRAQSPIHAVIVGGGIGGLFAANALIAHGIRVSVYEQAAALGEIGAGLILTPNSLRPLRSVGLGSRVARKGARIGPGSGFLRHDGTPIAPYLVGESSGHAELFGIHRADLVEILAGALPAGVVHTGCRCIGFEQDGDTARVRFADGATAAGDLVIAADGIHSALRGVVAPVGAAVFSGSVAYRGLVPRARIPDWPAGSWLMWLGQEKHFLAYPVRADAVINFAGFVPAREASAESWSSAGDPEALRREFAGWDPRIASLLGHVDATLCWPLYDREALASWTLGRLTLLGDAAHPMLPHSGQGANQSIEDGMALATILAQAGRDAIPPALLAYARMRRERVAAIQRRARDNGRRYESTGAALATRDADVAAQAEFRKRLYAHDVAAEARAAAATLPGLGAAVSARARMGGTESRKGSHHDNLTQTPAASRRRGNQQRAVCASWLGRRVSRSADPHRPGVSTRWRLRPHRAGDGRVAGAAARSTGDRREPAGCGRQSRNRNGGARAAGWLHPAVRDRDHRAQCVAL